MDTWANRVTIVRVIFIPVFVFLLAPARSALAGDTEGFLARTAMIQWALMICVYCVSHAPALLMLRGGNYIANAKLLHQLLQTGKIRAVSGNLQCDFRKILAQYREGLDDNAHPFRRLQPAGDRQP